MDQVTVTDHPLPVRVMLGTAVGDAYGLMAEGLPARHAAAIETWGPPFLGRAIVSDDTEQTFLVAQALRASGGDVEAFAKALRWRLIAWFCALPPGVGLGTARSVFKLALGFRRGVRTAGNGAAMRSPILGAVFAQEPEKVAELVRASTELTHTDPRAFVGALAVALAAGAHERGEGWREVLAATAAEADNAPHADRWRAAAEELERCLEEGASVQQYAQRIGCGDGVSGYVYDTVPVALYAWARYDDVEEGLTSVWRCGGDTDSVGAIAGALLCAKCGAPSAERLRGLRDRPLTLRVLRDAATDLPTDPATDGAPVRWRWWLLPLRNLAVLPVILVYGLRLIATRLYGRP